MILSMKNLVFKKRPARKLIKLYVGSYMIKEEVTTSANTVKIRLPALIRIHSMVNTSKVVRYRKPVKGYKIKKIKPIKIDKEKEKKVKRILNKNIVWRYIKYLVGWKDLTTEHNI